MFLGRGEGDIIPGKVNDGEKTHKHGEIYLPGMI